MGIQRVGGGCLNWMSILTHFRNKMIHHLVEFRGKLVVTSSSSKSFILGIRLPMTGLSSFTIKNIKMILTIIILGYSL